MLSNFEIKALILKYDEPICKQVKGSTYPEEMDFICAHEKRTNFIRKLSLDLKGNQLLLFQYVDKHGMILYKELEKHVSPNRNVYFIHGGVVNLHNVIFASPSKSKIRNLQSIGRGLRKGDTKNKATLYDIADDLSYRSYKNYTLNHFKERIKQYTEQEFDYSIYKINL